MIQQWDLRSFLNSVWNIAWRTLSPKASKKSCKSWQICCLYSFVLFFLSCVVNCNLVLLYLRNLTPGKFTRRMLYWVIINLDHMLYLLVIRYFFFYCFFLPESLGYLCEVIDHVYTEVRWLIMLINWTNELFG